MLSSDLRRRAAAASLARVVAVIPAYNEERFIGSVVLRARACVDAVIVVDDGSRDATAEIAERAGAIVVRHEANRGKGAALTTGFARARELEPAVVVTIDADGQHVAEEIPQVIEPVLRGEADLVIGSRYLDGQSEVPKHRVLGHWAFNLLTRQASGVSTTDSQSGFRAFSPRAIRSLSFHSRGFSVESEMQFLARDRKLRVAEVPITISYLDPPKRSVARHGLMVLNGLLRLVGQYRPLLFLGVPGLVGLLGGLAWGLLVVSIYTETRTLAVGYALIAVMLGIGGMVALSTGVILHSVRGLLLDLLHPDADRDRTG
jgi:glycosyltransferase involved in cell wall biosynthesis